MKTDKLYRTIGFWFFLAGLTLLTTTDCKEKPVSPPGTSSNHTLYKTLEDSLWEDPLVAQLEGVRDTIARRMLSQGINPDTLRDAMLTHNSGKLLALMGWSSITDAAFMNKADSIGNLIRSKYPTIDSMVTANGPCTTCIDAMAITAFHDNYYVRVNGVNTGVYDRTATKCSGNKPAYIATLVGCAAISETPFFLCCLIGAWCSYCPEAC